MSVTKAWKRGLAGAALMATLLAGAASADSQARVVRLSDVQGDVQIKRPHSPGFEKAFMNMPVVQGSEIRTNSGGLAEVQFEDGSAIRLTPGSAVSFPEMYLKSGGAHISTAVVNDGTAYLDFRGNKNDELTLKFGPEWAVLNRPAHLRLQMDNGQAIMAVFKGDVKVEGPAGTQLSGKQTGTFNLASADKVEVARNLESDPYDSWDKQQTQYAQTYDTPAGSGYAPYGYGMADLNYYGSYYDLPGYGTVWQPYFTGLGWSPFSNGAWLYYPGAGYNFTSAYPWGWTPYHYGSWLFAPGYGWMWQPGGAWTGLGYVPTVVNPPSNFTPPRPPSAPGQTQIVGSFPTSQPGLNNHKLEIPANTAGLGVPRGGVRNLPQVSQQVQQHGLATAKIGRGVAPVAAPIAPVPVGVPRGTPLMVPRASPVMAHPTGMGSRPGMVVPHSMPAPHLSSPHISSPHR